MKKKIKIYRMPISRVFPTKHPKAGEETNFELSILNGFSCKYCIDSNCIDCSIVRKIHTMRVLNPAAMKSTPGSISWKIHTMRALNPESKSKTWEEKIKEVQEGKAVLVVYDWKGKPYSADGCRNLFIFGIRAVLVFVDKLLQSDKYKHAIPFIDSGIGVQKTLFVPELNCLSVGNTEQNSVKTVGYSTIARNDGLSLDDFKAWFDDCDLSKPFEIIHFTEFRY